MPDLMPIPPTSGVSDPQVRAVLDALAHNARASGGDAATTEMYAAARSAVSDVLTGGNGGVPGSTALDNVIRRILTGRLLAELREPLGITALSQLLSEEERARRAGISDEQKVRAERDFALASAVNRVWASIGGSASVIEDVNLAAATPSTATATKWNAVVSAVTDPNTGAVVGASLKQTFDTYASAIDGTLSAAYTLRTDVNGHVAGFGLINDGTTADFVVNADAFGIASPSNPAVLPFAFDSATGSLRITGDIYAANGSFGGALNAATGTFSGSLTADAVNAVSTINLRGNAVSVVAAAYAPETTGAFVSVTVLNSDIPAGQSTVPIIVWASMTMQFATVFDIGVNQAWNTPGNLRRENLAAGCWAISVVYDAAPGTYTFGSFNGNASSSTGAVPYSGLRPSIAASLAKR